MILIFQYLIIRAPYVLAAIAITIAFIGAINDVAPSSAPYVNLNPQPPTQAEVYLDDTCGPWGNYGNDC